MHIAIGRGPRPLRDQHLLVRRGARLSELYGPARSAPPCLGELRLELSYRLSTPTLDFSGDAALVDTDASHGLFI